MVTLGQCDYNNISCSVERQCCGDRVASTLIDSRSSKTVKRWCKFKKANISVPIPNTVHLYNSDMGGTDRIDQNINKFRIGIRGKDWCIHQQCFDLEKLPQMRPSGKVTPQKKFRRRIALYYLTKYCVPAMIPGGKSTTET